MKKKINKIWKEASVFLILVIIVLSTFIIAVNSQQIIIPDNKSTCQLVIWDNGMHYSVQTHVQLDETNQYDCYFADDFQFEKDTDVCGGKWIGGYYGDNYNSGNFDYSIVFYNDRGDSNAPGDVFAGPFIFTHGMCNPVLIEDTGDEVYYEYTVEFPEPILFNGDEKYWVSSFGIGTSPPKSLMLGHTNNIRLHQAVAKSDYYGYPNWTDGDRVSFIGDRSGGAFQLLRVQNSPSIPFIEGPRSGKVGEEQDFNLNSTDPEGDNLLYYIDWGDGSKIESIGWVPSGEEQTVTHTWNKKGTYNIKAMTMDFYNAESEWMEHEVEMPKTKATNSPFITFLQNHPNLFPILRQILGI